MFIYLANYMYILLFLTIASLSPFHYTEDVFRIGISDSIIESWVYPSQFTGTRNELINNVPRSTTPQTQINVTFHKCNSESTFYSFMEINVNIC